MEDLLKKSDLKAAGEEIIQEAIGKKNAADYDVSGDVVIHTMPKRYLVQENSGKKAKSVGLFIFIIGFLFLAAGLFGLYRIIVSTNNRLIKIPSTKDNQITPTPSQSQTLTKNSTSSQEKDNDLQVNQVASTTATTSIMTMASSSLITATGTTKIATNTPVNIDPLDTDYDGLSDMEEIIFGTDIKKTDSDDDGYEDRSEVINLYNPIGKGRLWENKAIDKYINLDYGYSLLYPVISSISREGKDSIIFKLDKNQFILVVMQDVPADTNLDDWYMEQMGIDIIPPDLRINHGDWQGIAAKNKMTVYLKHPNKNFILIMNYSMATEDILYYKNIFAFMVKSVALVTNNK